MIIFTEGQIRNSIVLNERTISVIEDAFTSMTLGKVIMPPIMRVDIKDHNGEVDVKTAYIKGRDQFAIKISSGFFDNHRLGLPSGNGMMLLLSTKTGVPEAVLLDNGYLTDIRTAAAGAIAARYLAREQVEAAGVIGTGTQAVYQTIALYQERRYQRLYVYGRNPKRLESYKNKVKEVLEDVEIIVAQSPEQVVKECHVVVTTTPSTSPIIQSDWLHPGLHITAMGSDAEHKQELAADTFSKADLIVCDVKAQCFTLGELHHGLESGFVSKHSSILELGELTSGHKQGRTNDEQITVCDLTGTGVQDTAIAIFAYRQMEKQGYGHKI